MSPTDKFILAGFISTYRGLFDEYLESCAIDPQESELILEALLRDEPQTIDTPKRGSKDQSFLAVRCSS